MVLVTGPVPVVKEFCVIPVEVLGVKCILNLFQRVVYSRPEDLKLGFVQSEVSIRNVSVSSGSDRNDIKLTGVMIPQLVLNNGLW